MPTTLPLYVFHSSTSRSNNSNYRPDACFNCSRLVGHFCYRSSFLLFGRLVTNPTGVVAYRIMGADNDGCLAIVDLQLKKLIAAPPMIKYFCRMGVGIQFINTSARNDNLWCVWVLYFFEWNVYIKRRWYATATERREGFGVVLF